LIDINSDGQLSRKEIKIALEKMVVGIKSDEINEIFEIFDCDNSDDINLNEFIMAFQKMNGKNTVTRETDNFEDTYLLTDQRHKILYKIGLAIEHSNIDIAQAFDIIDKDKSN
jgi:Ca2+-binding EF-hand superfamily protein